MNGFVKVVNETHKTAKLVSLAIEDKPKPMGARVKTLTLDICREYAYQARIDQAQIMQTYFSDPYWSKQHSCSNNYSVLLRQYIPKKHRMKIVKNEVLAIIKNLNDGPSKRPLFDTQDEVFHAWITRSSFNKF